MRRVEGKLSALNWKLVLFAGIFQILTLIFDQVVIQYEEKNREMTFNLLTESEQRSAYLSMNRRVYNFTLAFENMCTTAGTKPGVIQFNLGVSWVTEEQVENIAGMLEKQIGFPTHP